MLTFTRSVGLTLLEKLAWPGQKYPFLFHFEHYKQYCRHYCKTKLKLVDAQSQNFKHKKIIPFIYASGGIGVFMFILIIKRECDKWKLRLQGFEKLSIPEFGSRALAYRYKDTVLFDVVYKTVKDVEQFKVRPDDVWVVSFPRSGTTWLQEIIYLIETNLDFKSAQLNTLDYRFPYLEFEYPGIKEVESRKSPRLIKSHLPLHLLPDSFGQVKPKVVYIARNPRDVVVSYFHYARLLLPLRYQGDFTQFCDLYLKNLVPYSPWSNHVLQFWEHRHDDNVLFITYEQLYKRTRETIREIATFLGKSLSERDISRITEHCGFEMMKRNESVNHAWFDELGLCRDGEAPFMRSGKVGAWQEYFSPTLNVRMEQMIQRQLRDTGLYFDYHASDAGTE